jgi:hypothetical protein
MFLKFSKLSKLAKNLYNLVNLQVLFASQDFMMLSVATLRKMKSKVLKTSTSTLKSGSFSA